MHSVRHRWGGETGSSQHKSPHHAEPLVKPYIYGPSRTRLNHLYTGLAGQGLNRIYTGVAGQGLNRIYKGLARQGLNRIHTGPAGKG